MRRIGVRGCSSSSIRSGRATRLIDALVRDAGPNRSCRKSGLNRLSINVVDHDTLAIAGPWAPDMANVVY